MKQVQVKNNRAMKHLFLTMLLIFSISTQSQTIMRIHMKNGSIIQIPLSTIDSITYFNGNPGNLATLTTNAPGNITNGSASSGGNITNDGGSPVTQRGICWATSPNPTIANTVVLSGKGSGSFTTNITGLNPNTTYYIRAFASNTAGIAYGNQLSFTTLPTPIIYGSVSDISGNTYPTVTIGTQVWMAENLRTTKYNDGSNIPVVEDSIQWSLSFDRTSPMMCWYNNDPATYTANKFGALYNWFAVDTIYNGNKNVCPVGWHVPTDAEWTTLTDFLGGEAIAGGKMKSTGTQYWVSPNTGATNSSGFSALPSGYRNEDGTSRYFGIGCFWWTSTDGTWSNYDPWIRHIYADAKYIQRLQSIYTVGNSVRCLKD